MHKYLFYFSILVLASINSGCFFLQGPLNSETENAGLGKLDEKSGQIPPLTSKEIEDKILERLKKRSQSSQNPKYLDIISGYELALGTRTIKFIENVKNYDQNDIEEIKTGYLPVIKERLNLIASLKGYKPSNDMEKKIIEQIKYYKPYFTFWSGDDTDATKSGSGFYKDMKIGPLKNGKFLYIKLHIDPPHWSNIKVVRDEQPDLYEVEIIDKNKEVPIRVGVTTAPGGEGVSIYVYFINHQYPRPVRHYDIISRKWR